MSNEPLRLKPKREMNWETPNKAPQKKRSFHLNLKLPKAKPKSNGNAPRPTAKAIFSGAAAKLKNFVKTPAAAQGALCLCLALISFLYAGVLQDDATTVLANKRELPVYSVERSDKVIAISFDASWGSEQTLQILDTLDEYDVKTTFFLVGIWVDKYPELVTEIVSRGHEIGNHSATHPYMTKISQEKMREELRIMSDKVETLTGVRPTLFRPPYGDYNNQVVTTVRAEGYEVVQWSVDSLDWKNYGVEDIIKRCTQKVENGDIVLFHNDAQYTPEALPTVLKYYQDQGFTIIPVSQILLEGDTTIDVQGKQHPVKTAEPAT